MKRPLNIFAIQIAPRKLKATVSNFSFFNVIKLALLLTIVFSIQIFSADTAEAQIQQTKHKHAAISCQSLFLETSEEKTESKYPDTNFIIAISSKSTSKSQLHMAHKNLLQSEQHLEIFNLLKKIKKTGTELLTPDEIKFIQNFRQDSSMLRSMFQTSTKKHESPEEFAKFVRDFGHLKDMVNISANEMSKKTAEKIIKKYRDLDFNKLLKDQKAAKPKSIQKYFESIISDIEIKINKNQVTVDEIHDVRKGLRDILRYLEAQAKIKESQKIKLSELENNQLLYLKQVNKKLGRICDSYAEQILEKKLSKKTIVPFPEKIKLRIKYFLDHYQIVQIKDVKKDEK